MRKFIAQIKGKRDKKEDAPVAGRSVGQPAKNSVTKAVTAPSDNRGVKEDTTQPAKSAQSDAKIEPYVYKRLFQDNVSDNIRIYVIFPGAKDSAISGSMRHVSLGKQPLYECLSYAWGNATEKKTILCDGKTLEITQNLYEALRLLRYTDKPRALWIDQICIDQQNIRERSIQVLRMAGIFNYASSVSLYLGDLGPGGAEAYSLIVKMCSTMGKESINSPEAFHTKKKTMTAEDWVQQYGLPPFNSDAWKKIAEMFTARVFRRIWVLQEIVLARNLHIFWAGFKLPWEQPNNDRYLWPNFGLFINLISILSHTWPKGAQLAPNRVRNAEFLSDCLLIREQPRRPGGSLSLPLMLERTRAWESTDPRDKIFGVLCIVKRGDLLGIPDYSLRVDELYALTARRLVEHSFSLRQLHYVEMDLMSFRNTRELPSWVADWRKPMTTVYHGNMFQDFPQYSPALRSKPIVLPQKAPNKLGLRGLLLDTIKTIGPGGYTREVVYEGHGAWWDIATSISGNATYLPTNEPIAVALARTRVTDCWPDSERYIPPTQASLGTDGEQPTVIPLVLPDESSKPYWPKLLRHIENMTVLKRLCATKDHGYLAMVPTKTEVGDAIVFS